MAARRSDVILLLLLLIAGVSVPAAAFETVYAFGDSFTDTGNTHSTTGPYSFGYVSSPPYGATFFHRSTNRYSDGRLVVDFLADRLALPGFLPPYLSPAAANATHGVNFAVAGATAIEHEFFARNNLSVDITPQSIMTELAWFEAHLRRSPAAARAVGDALFWVGEIGANDYAYSFMAATTIPQDQIRNMAIDRLTTFIEALLKKGAKYIIVQGLPLTGCLPLTMTLARPEDRDNISCAATVNQQSHAHNRRLQASLRRLRRQHPAAVIAYADYYAAHLAVMAAPARYGFTEPFKTCCGAGGGAYNFEIFSTCGSPEVTTACAQPAKYVNWDGVHMTEAMYRVVAGMFFQDGRYCHPPFSTLLARRNKGN
ncbi:GDSL esterase/lipase At3g48460 [Oryza glaberrima]|uniref:Esterase n=1 Tax=Oryza glaberrima TaxID=4538 RepID=I1PHA5_ORYGL|nr:GDSL esterase/lipase At3g48460 [Oryza glaberrima]